MSSNRRSRTCSSCGTLLSPNAAPGLAVHNAGNSTSPVDNLCVACRLKESVRRGMIPSEECPRCHSTKVLRAPGGVREEILVCPHCDHIWSRSRS
jgi:hypothetical protein